jgi:hypothetical protein
VTAAVPAWQGCHGVRLRPVDRAAQYGTCTGAPLLDAELTLGTPDGPSGRRLWQISTTVDVAGEDVPVEQQLVRDAAGNDVLVGLSGPLLAVDHRRRLIMTPTSEDDPRTLQMVTTFAIPLLLHEAGVLVLHAAACTRDGVTVLIAGRSGSGKSSTLLALIDAGWSPLSEDLCAVDQGDEHPRVWPGPPWLRRAPGAHGPSGSSVRFEALDKVGWDLSARMAAAPADLDAVVFLEPPGGSTIEHDRTPSADAVAHLAQHAVWLGDPDDRAPALFTSCARLSGAVPAWSLRVPWQPDWGDVVRAVESVSTAVATSAGSRSDPS